MVKLSPKDEPYFSVKTEQPRASGKLSQKKTTTCKQYGQVANSAY